MNRKDWPPWLPSPSTLQPELLKLAVGARKTQRSHWRDGNKSSPERLAWIRGIFQNLPSFLGHIRLNSRQTWCESRPYKRPWQNHQTPVYSVTIKQLWKAGPQYPHPSQWAGKSTPKVSQGSHHHCNVKNISRSAGRTEPHETEAWVPCSPKLGLLTSWAGGGATSQAPAPPLPCHVTCASVSPL